jgi:hypothetical protein
MSEAGVCAEWVCASDAECSVQAVVAAAVVRELDILLLIPRPTDRVLIPPSPQALDPDAWEAEHEANPPAAKGARKSKSKSKGRKKRCVAFLVVSLSLSFCLALLFYLCLAVS